MSTLHYNAPLSLITTAVTLNQNLDFGWAPMYSLGYFIQAVWTGTPTGYFYLSASGDDFLTGTDITPSQRVPMFIPQMLQNPTRSNIISGSQYNVTAAGSNAWNVTNARYNFVRMSYVDQSSGASAAQITFLNISQKGPA